VSKTPAFVEFVLDQLGGIDGVRAQAMFGGTGLYCNDVFFGIIHRDILYLKVNPDTRAAYERAGMKPFKPYPRRPMSMQYYEVPLAVLEDPRDLAVWAERAVAVAAAGKPKRPLNRSRRAARHR
jgi:DNA transformation protein and related proteins